MTGPLLAALAVTLSAETGLLVAAVLRLRGLPQLVLGAYVIAFAEIVGLTLFLSAFGAVTRSAILVGLAGIFAAAVAAWFLVGAPRPARVPARSVGSLRNTPALLVLALTTGLALMYVVALLVGTHPNNWDSMTYHLARAALWSQNDSVGYIPDVYDERLNANPPNAEIAQTLLLEVGQNERVTGLVQFAAALAIAVAVFALARTLDLSRRQAAFGALLILMLPIVLLQASTTQNDLVAASFLMASAVFLVGTSGRDVTLGALATALAIGTKIPAGYGVPILLAVALVAPPIAHRTRRIAAVLIGAAVGSYWYVVNIVRTGHPLGDLADETGLVAFLDPTTNVLAAFARILDAFDLSGAVGDDWVVYVLVAAAVVVVLLLTARGSVRQRVLPASLTGALVVVPLLFVPVHYVLWRVFAKLHDVLEAPDGHLPVQRWESQTVASESISGFGPLGLLLVVGVGAAAAVLVRRRSLPPLALILAVAPLAWFLLLALSVDYDEWQGRFFVFPIALSASLWGLVLPVSRYAAFAVVAIASTAAALSLVHFREKPSGLRLVERDVPSSVWGLDRWQTQSLVRSEMGPVYRFVDRWVPSGSVIALALGEDDFGYPAFGEGLARTIELVPDSSPIHAVRGAEWLLANPERSLAVDRSCWRLAFGMPDDWKVFRRSAEECPP